MTTPNDDTRTDSGVSEGDRNRAAMRLADRKKALLSLREEELFDPVVTADRALELSANIHKLVRDLAGPYPFQADYFAEVKELAESSLLDDALAYFAASEARASSHGTEVTEDIARHDVHEADGYHVVDDAQEAATDLWRRAYTFWATGYDKVVRVGRFYAETPSTWPRLDERDSEAGDPLGT
jgi:hypothetical protein